MLAKIDKLQNYHPTYWLSSLGAGGIAITFFMYLMWLIPKETPIPTFSDWTLYLNEFNYMTIISLFSVAGFLLFSFFHFYLINWNIKAFKMYGDKFKSNNIHNPAHLQLMSIPLSFAMSINVMFVAGSLFVPNIWNVIEYLFPFAILAFSIIGFYSLKFYAEHINHIFSYQIKFEEFNSFAAMMPAFTFLMVSVGLAAPSAMSLNETTVVVVIILSRLFLIAAILTMLISVFIGIKAILPKFQIRKPHPIGWG